MGKAQGRVAGDGSPSIQDFGDAVGRNIQLPRQFGGAHAQLLQLLRQMFTRVNWNYCHDVSPNGSQQYILIWGRAPASSAISLSWTPFRNGSPIRSLIAWRN